MTAAARERIVLLRDLRRQLPSTRRRAQTERAIRRLEHELAPGRGAESEALRQLDLGEAVRTR